jgi:hypothetical protein
MLGHEFKFQYHRKQKLMSCEYYLITCLGLSFQDPLDNSLPCECMPEETDSSENSLHPDFAKVIKLTLYLHIKLSYLLLTAFMEKMEMLSLKM